MQQKLQERGDKISAIHEGSNRLAMATDNWLRQCEEIAKQKKEKKWWEL
jgi:1-aminocyclopropane-1-carboxylate deaminase/D-cysteine desulfhydrase-like pyridoxal-dependent ACC family enzyme